jgi:hypothetical protein
LLTVEKPACGSEIEVEVPFIPTRLPLLLMFRLLGVHEVEQCRRLVLDDEASCSEKLRNRVQSILAVDSSKTAGFSEDQLLDWIVAKMEVERERKHKTPAPKPVANPARPRNPRRPALQLLKQIQVGPFHLSRVGSVWVRLGVFSFVGEA